MDNKIDELWKKSANQITLKFKDPQLEAKVLMNTLATQQLMTTKAAVAAAPTTIVFLCIVFHVTVCSGVF